MENLDHAPTWAEFAARLGTALHQARIAKQYSQERVAYGAGLSRYTYQKFEKGESRPGTPANPSLQNVLALCQVLDIALDDLLPSPLPHLLER